MKKKISALALAGLMVAGNAYASGFRIPEQSVDSTAKAGANIASSTRADAAYYNPANMSWLEDTTMIQGNLTYIHLTKNEYASDVGGISAKAEDENFVVPTGFIVSPYYGDFRFGLALTSPYGLAKRWKNNVGSLSAREFAMETFELNPTLSYRINDKVSLAGGVRMMYANATIKNVYYDMSGDTIEWGYNLALSVRPTESWNISATYRSKIDLNFSESDVRYNPTGVIPGGSPIISASTSVPAPAVLALSTAFQPMEKLTVELTIDRTFWSTYDKLDIATTPAIYSISSPKDWDDSNAYRIGLSYDLNQALTLMAGFAYDECPAPDSTVGFELPDAPAWLYSVGFQYAMTENLDFGMAVLYDYKEERHADSPGGLPPGEFTNGGAFLVTTGLNYRF